MSGNTVVFVSVIAAVIVAVIAAIAGYRHLSCRNRRRNDTVDRDPSLTTKNKLINDQHADTGRRFVYGFHAARRNACETIAVHNAKVLLGRESTLSQTMADFQVAGAMIGYGLFGSNPHAIGRVLRRSGIAYARVGLADMTRRGVYIISFWNEHAPWGGLHTVAVRYDGRRYITYNLKGQGKVTSLPPSVYARHFICGYFLE